MTPAAWQNLLADRVAAMYRPVGRFAFHFARGKVRADPFYRDLFALGLATTAHQVLDLGCGQGLLACALAAASQLHGEGLWPEENGAAWPAPPAHVNYQGVEYSAREVRWAEQALASQPAPFGTCRQGAIEHMDFDATGLICLIDVLHYLGEADQICVLQRVYTALPPHGRLLLRIGDMQSQRVNRISQTVDWLVSQLRGCAVSRLHCRPLPAWLQLLESLGFSVQVLSTHRSAHCANVLLQCERIMVP